MDLALLEVANEAFVMQNSLASMASPIYSDDLLSTMQAFESQHLYKAVTLVPPPSEADSDTFKWRFLSEMYRVLGLHVDYSIDAHPQQIINNGAMQRCMGIQASLGWEGASLRPSLPALVAQTALELKHSAYAVMALMRLKPGYDTDSIKLGQSFGVVPARFTNYLIESVRYSVSLTTWLMALFGFIMDELFTLGDFLEECQEQRSDLIDSLNQKGPPHLTFSHQKGLTCS